MWEVLRLRFFLLLVLLVILNALCDEVLVPACIQTL